MPEATRSASERGNRIGTQSFATTGRSDERAAPARELHVVKPRNWQLMCR